jgi:hypothetical protein
VDARGDRFDNRAVIFSNGRVALRRMMGIEPMLRNLRIAQRLLFCSYWV